MISQAGVPTKISSIEIDLTARSSTSWPEGIGARRLEVAEEHVVFSAKTVFFKGGATPRRTVSIGPGTRDEAVRDDWDGESVTSGNLSRGASERETDRSRASRRISLDSSFFHPHPVVHSEDHRMLHTPPYSPSSASPLDRSVSTLSPRASLRHEDSPAQTLEDLRNALLSSATTPDHARNGHSPNGGFDFGGIRPRRDGSRSLSRRPSIEDIPENEPGPSRHSTLFHRHTNGATSPRSVESNSSQDVSSQRDDDHKNEHRGRKHHRFSLASIIDAVRPSSPRSRERHHEREPSRGRSVDVSTNGTAKATSRERPTLGKLGDIIKLDSAEDKKEGRDGWKEFKKGTYTYPISFQIPGHSPPSLQCSFGAVVWQLKATVHRPGTFTSKLSATREVNVICSPGTEDTEDTENIIVERQWEDQLQYLISISGRSFYIGGTVPVQFTLMPLGKVKIYRISVYIEERVDYYTHMKRVARTDPINRILLLSLKHDEKGGGPILPLVSDDPDAFKKSPLMSVLTHEDDLSDMASSFMGPGPWSFHHELRLPTSCHTLHFTNKNRRANIIITHMIKCVLRVERGDDKYLDAKSGKRKLFDIVIQTPIQILSCRCNPEWISLPPYSESYDDHVDDEPQCPCVARKASNSPISRMNTNTSSNSSVSTVASSFLEALTSPTPRRYESLLDQNTLFERLVGGQETEAGEVPPSYDAVARGRDGVNGY
ncbi:hypothetical protein ONZ45_g18372 [Pleurotus djamor]|nr:hypothetical protein ONZ45_g18372 [Pleurotus djamor]